MNPTASQVINFALAVLVLVLLIRIGWRRLRRGLPDESINDVILRERMYGLVLLALASVGILSTLGPVTTAYPELLEPIRFLAAIGRAIALVLLLGLVTRR